MCRLRTILVTSLGGVVCGSLLGSLSGAGLGALWGAFTGNVGLGLDGALLGAGALAVAGAVYGAILGAGESAQPLQTTEVNPHAAAPHTQDESWPSPMAQGPEYVQATPWR